MPKLPDNKNLSIRDASELLSVSEKTLRRWEESRKLIPERTSGGHRRYSLEAINQYKNSLHDKKIYATKKPLVYSIPAKKIRRLSPAPKPYQPFVGTTSKDETYKFVSPDISSPQIYKPLHFNQKKIIRTTIASAFGIMLLVTCVRIAPSFIAVGKNIIGKYLPEAAQISSATIAENDFGEAKVLADRDSILASVFNINIPTNLREDVDVAGNLNLSGNILSSTDDMVLTPGGGGLSVGGGTPTNVDLLGDDLYVSGDFEAAGDTFAVNSTLTGDIDVTGDASVGSLTINAETFTDLTGTGLTLTSGALTTTIGTSVDSSEITDDSIVEVDLK